MTIDVNLTSKKTGDALSVSKEGNIGVVVHPHPPPGEEGTLPAPSRQYFTDGGGPADSNDMAVNGSVTPVDFIIKADPEADLYVKTMSVLISEAGAKLNLFGAQPALTNGVEWILSSQDQGEVILHDGIKDNLEFVRTALGSPAFGTGTSAFRADLTGGGADAYLPELDLSTIFGLPWGIRLRAGTKDKFIFRVRDNISALTTFNIIGYGFTMGID